jgi:hypothetical protein
MIRIILAATLSIILFTGCSQKSEIQKNEDKQIIKNQYLITKEVREDNIVHYGQYAEVWVAPYKDNEGDLFDERILYFWVEEPDFKIGEKLSYKTNAKNLPENMKHQDFSINESEFKNENNKDLKIELNHDVKRFLEENGK